MSFVFQVVGYHGHRESELALHALPDVKISAISTFATQIPSDLFSLTPLPEMCDVNSESDFSDSDMITDQFFFNLIAPFWLTRYYYMQGVQVCLYVEYGQREYLAIIAVSLQNRPLSV